MKEHSTNHWEQMTQKYTNNRMQKKKKKWMILD